MLESIAKVITDAVRGILFMLDQVVYGLIPTVYKLIISLANVDLYSGNPAVSALLNRVYIIVGIFMLFKLAFSILRYIIDPNSFSDQSKGFTSLVKRVLIALLLLVSTPWLFNKVYDYQKTILESNIISNLILGTNEGGLSDIESSAKDLQFMMFGPFFSLNTETADLDVCKPDSKYPLANVISSTDMALKDDGKCIQQFSDLIFEDDTVKASGTTVGVLFKTSDTEDGRDFGRLGGLLTWTVDDGVYGINYTPIISTICGGYLVFLLLSFCIDVAARAIKLLFLQILSPIAIISSVDPTSSSQNDKLKDWGMECLRTFLSLFLRLAVIYVVIQMIKIITSKLFSSPDGIYNAEFAKNNMETIANLNIFVYIFLILGAFSVAKKIPELIEKAFGIKMSGELSMNPFKTFTSNAGFGLLAGAATGAVAGGLSGGISAFSTAMNHEKGLGRSLISGAGGILSGGATGTFRGGRAKGGKGWETGMQSGGRIARRMEVREATGGIKGVPSMAMDRLRDKMGAPTTYQSREARASRYDDVEKSVKGIDDYMTGELGLKSNDWKAIQANKMVTEKVFQEGTGFDNQTATERMAYYEQQRSYAENAFNDVVASGASVDSDEYKAAAERLRKEQTTYDRMEDIYTKPGSLSQQDYLYLQNDAFEREQALKEEYYDNGGIVSERDASGNATKVSASADLASHKNELDKAVRDTRDVELGEVDTSSWANVGKAGIDTSVKAKAHSKSLGIRSSDKHNDARDRDAAIHGAHSDAHMKH